MKVGMRIECVYGEEVFEGEVVKVGVSKAGLEYVTLKTFVANDVMGPVYRSLHVAKMSEVRVLA